MFSRTVSIRLAAGIRSQLPWVQFTALIHAEKVSPAYSGDLTVDVDDLRTGGHRNSCGSGANRNSDPNANASGCTSRNARITHRGERAPNDRVS